MDTIVENRGVGVRTIGMLGGMSWESTLEYYRLANELVRERLGGFHSAPILLDSVDFAEVEVLQSTGEWSRAGQLLASHARTLEDAGAEVLVLCTNTMHSVIEHIEEAVGIPVVHIVDATARVIRESGARHVALLGTAFTMEADFYRERLATYGIDVVVPQASDRKIVHRVIYEELVLGLVRDESRQEYRAIIERLVANGAEGVILGCTEIELLITAADSPVPVFPTTRIHVEAAVDLAASNRQG
jgi:aspartate racemase